MPNGVGRDDETAGYAAPDTEPSREWGAHLARSSLRSPVVDWLIGVLAHGAVLVMSALPAAGIVVMGLLMTVGLNPRPTSQQKLGAAIVVVAAALVVLVPQVVVAWIRLGGRTERRTAGTELLGAAVAAAIVVSALAGANLLAVARRDARAGAADHALLARTGLVMYRPGWLPADFAGAALLGASG